jgi:chromosome segregation ATPase
VETQLNMHQYSGLFDLDSPERQKAVESSAGGLFPLLSNPIRGLATTVNQVPGVANCLSRYHLRMPTDQMNPHSSNNRANGSSNLTNGDPLTPEWSSAVGHAATGKSGRVIHNLQEEIARLTRECSVYRSRAEETQRMNDAYKTQVQNMTERLRNLEQAHETNLSSISRKDKKIEELRAEVQNEKDRRQRAEAETNKFHQLMDESRDDFNRKCAELQEITNHSRTQYDVLAKSGQRERADQQRRLKAIRDEIDALKSQQDDKTLQLERLDAVMAQKNREIEIGRENFDKLFEAYESYKRAHDEEVNTLVEKGRQGDAKLEAALASLKETEGQMKWVIQVKKEVKNAK